MSRVGTLYHVPTSEGWAWATDPCSDAGMSAVVWAALSARSLLGRSVRSRTRLGVAGVVDAIEIHSECRLVAAVRDAATGGLWCADGSDLEVLS